MSVTVDPTTGNISVTINEPVKTIVVKDSVARGIQGAQGLQGPAGGGGSGSGSQGTQGIQGVQGTQGLQGLQGRQGIQGLQGLGSQGTQGTQGIQGLQGLQGIQGVQGIQGLQGLQGTQGIQGIQGLQGLQGTQGLQGEQGLQGIQGAQGLQGVQGTQGLQGLQGLQGVQGIQGSTGVSPGGSTNNVAKFTGATTLSNSQIYDDGTNIGIGTNSPTYKFQVIGNTSLRSANVTTDLFVGTDGADSVNIPTPTLTVLTGGSLNDSIYYFRITGVDVFGNKSHAINQSGTATNADNTTIRISWIPVPWAVSYEIFYTSELYNNSGYYDWYKISVGNVTTYDLTANYTGTFYGVDVVQGCSLGRLTFTGALAPAGANGVYGQVLTSTGDTAPTWTTQLNLKVAAGGGYGYNGNGWEGYGGQIQYNGGYNQLYGSSNFQFQTGYNSNENLLMIGSVATASEYSYSGLVANKANFFGSAVDGIMVLGAQTNGSGWVRTATSLPSVYYQQYDNSHRWGIDSSGTGGSVGSYVTFTEAMRISNTANVGIATTNPSEKLEVTGKIKTSGGILTRSNTSISNTTTLTWTSDTSDILCITAQDKNLTINADSGSPTNGQKMMFRIKSTTGAGTFSMTTGSAKAFRLVGVLLPTSLTVGNTLYVGCMYNSAELRWDILAVREGA